MDDEAIETMLKMEGDMFVITITIKEPNDPSTFIVVGQLNNWTSVRFSKSGEKKFCNASPDVFFNIFNKMNSDLAYFDVSHNIEILHLNDSMNLKMKLKNSWKRKLNLWNQLLKFLIWVIMRIHV